MKSILIQHNKHSDKFQIRFQFASIQIGVHQLVELLQDIFTYDPNVFELGFLDSVHPVHKEKLKKKCTYQLYFGRTYLLLNQREVTTLLSQLWTYHPLLMQWILSDSGSLDSTRFDSFDIHAQEN